jgi:sporulation protein YlmC with PRC-barrel domain
MWRCALFFAAAAFLADATAQDQYRHLYEPGELRLDEIIGMEVVTAEGRRLGRITDVTFDRATGSIEDVAVGAARYPLSALISDDKPGRVVVRELPLVMQELSSESSAGASALLPISTGRKSPRASRELGAPEEIRVDLREGRIRPRR